MGREPWRVRLLLVGVALLAAVVSGVGVHLVREDLRDTGDSADRPPAPDGSSPASPEASPTAPRSAPPQDPDQVPEEFLGTWRATYPAGDGSTQSRTLDLRPGGVGEDVLTLEGRGPGYRCAWRAELRAVGPPLVLGPSRVELAEPASSCQPGGDTRLELLDDGRQLRRVFVAGDSETVTYTRG